MRSASYTDIRARTFALLRQPGGTNVDTQDETDFRNAFARNFRRAWQSYEWPFSVCVERADVGSDGAVALNVRGEVVCVYADDPRTCANPRELPYVIGDNFFNILGARRPKQVWVRYKLWEPEFDWADYSASATYDDWDCAWKDGQLMVFSAATSAWTAVAIPYEFKEFLALTCAGDLARGSDDQRTSEFYALGERALDDEIFNYVRALNRAQTLNVETYKNVL